MTKRSCSACWRAGLGKSSSRLWRRPVSLLYECSLGVAVRWSTVVTYDDLLRHTTKRLELQVVLCYTEEDWLMSRSAAIWRLRVALTFLRALSARAPRWWSLPYEHSSVVRCQLVDPPLTDLSMCRLHWAHLQLLLAICLDNGFRLKALLTQRLHSHLVCLRNLSHIEHNVKLLVENNIWWKRSVDLV